MRAEQYNYICLNQYIIHSIIHFIETNFDQSHFKNCNTCKKKMENRFEIKKENFNK